MEEQLTKNFNIKEWRCHDGTDVPYNLVDNVRQCAENLQSLRDAIGVKGVPPSEVAAVIELLIEGGKMEQGGLGVYDEDGFTHYDCRGTRARWKG